MIKKIEKVNTSMVDKFIKNSLKKIFIGKNLMRKCQIIQIFCWKVWFCIIIKQFLTESVQFDLEKTED